MSPGPSVVIDRAGAVPHLVLDAPPRNTMDGRFFDDLARVVERDLPGLDAPGLVVRGRARHFSSGADVAGLLARVVMVDGALEGLERNAACFFALARLRYPVVAAIGGCCLGSGLELALACHFRIAARGAVLAMPEVEFGLVPGCGGTVRLVEIVGAPRAADLVISGRMVDASEALGMGLVDMVVERKDLVRSAEALVAAISSGGGPD